MITSSLGRLEKIALRTVFADEAADFTPWLAKDENLALLGETIDLSLQVETQEKSVGPFRADILCKDAESEHWVLIENQIERTDHTHLGQLLTYAAGLDAVTIIWIAERFTDEHRAALDWLNKKTETNINFFGLEIQLWRIGASPVAPKFNIVCQPNGWSRSVQAAAERSEAKTELREAQLRFWTAFYEFMQGSTVRCQKPKPERQMAHPIGRAGMWLTSVISTWDSVGDSTDYEMRVELNVADINAKARFAVLERQRDEIERACGGSLIWFNQPDVNRCRIFARQKANFLDESQWPVQHKWLREKLELFQKVFVPIAQSIDLDKTPEHPGATL